MPEDAEQLRGGHPARGQLGLGGSSDGIVASHSWLGTLESATSWADLDSTHSLAHFLPDPTGIGWPEKGECPHLDDSELMVNTLEPGERSVPTQTPLGSPLTLATPYPAALPFQPLPSSLPGLREGSAPY